MFTTPLTMGEGKVERKTKYNKETLDWLERKSDKNLLRTKCIVLPSR